MGDPLATVQTVTYPLEQFTEEEQARLAPHFTNLDRPVFALVNLPETVKGALFARYSRYAGTLRRLFLDEFAESLPDVPVEWSSEGERAAKLYETIFLGYGDDSVAQLGGAHIACEWTSNLLTKILQRPRLAAYLEQSTRYIAYDAQLDGFGYRYHRDPRFGPAYEAAMDELFATYSAFSPGSPRGWTRSSPRRRGSRRLRTGAPYARRRSTSSAASCRRRRSRTSGSTRRGQTYEQLVLHLLAHPLAEARAYGEMLLEELQAVMPSFVTRVPRPDRGGRWIEYLRERSEAAAAAAARLGLDETDADEAAAPSVRLLRTHGSEEELLAALLYESSGGRRGAGAHAPCPPVGGGARRARPRARRRAREPAPPAGARLRDAHVPLRDRLRLRRVPRPAAAPPAHVPVAAAVAGSRRRRSARGRGGGAGRGVRARARDLPHRVRAAARRRPRRGGALRALPRLSASGTSSSSTRARRCT